MEIESIQGFSDRVSLERVVELRKQLASLLALEEKLVSLLVLEEKCWKQRAEAHKLKGGDLNTRFYHQMASSRKKRNKITGLMDEDGNWKMNPPDMEHVVFSYFDNLFTPNENLSDIDQVTCHIKWGITTILKDTSRRLQSK